ARGPLGSRRVLSGGRGQRLPRILHVSEAFGGGVQEMVATLSERLEAAGYPVAIAYGRRPETPVDVRERVAPEVELFSLGWERRTLPEQLRACRRLRRLVRTWRPDVVHLHSSFAGLIGGVALTGLGVPSVYTPHGYSFTMGDQSSARSRACRLAERLSARRATVVGTVSEAEAAAARTVAPAAKVRVVRHGLPELDGLTRGAQGGGGAHRHPGSRRAPRRSAAARPPRPAAGDRDGSGHPRPPAARIGPAARRRRRPRRGLTGRRRRRGRDPGLRDHRPGRADQRLGRPPHGAGEAGRGDRPAALDRL